MNNYLSEFIGKFGGETSHLISDDNHDNHHISSPKIDFITLYNTSWASGGDETFKDLFKQILFFISPQTSKHRDPNEDTSGVSETETLREQLNTVGLLRGSYSLLSDFESVAGPVTIQTKTGAIVIMNIRTDYYLAISLLLNTKKECKKSICVKQLISIASRSHDLFELMNSPIESLAHSLGKVRLCDLLRRHWISFLDSFNLDPPMFVGSSSVLWPNRLNHRGFFDFLPQRCCKMSSQKLNELSKNETDSLVCNFEPQPAAYFLANAGSILTKNSGLLHVNLGDKITLDRESVMTVYQLMDELHSNICLSYEFFNRITRFEDIYSCMTREWQLASESEELTSQTMGTAVDDDEADCEGSEGRDFAESSAFAMLNPISLTKTLVVSPIHGTVNGFMNLGKAVTDQMYEAPNWVNNLNYFTMGPQNQATETNSIIDEANSPNKIDFEGFLIGSRKDSISRLLVHIPTVLEDGSKKLIEYSLVAYKQNETIAVLFYESGIEALEKLPFYAGLEKNLLSPMFDTVSRSLSGLPASLDNSVGSLPILIRGTMKEDLRMPGSSSDNLDSQFFYIIYDPQSKSYETSLPSLQATSASQKSYTRPKSALSRLMFHLHDHLIMHYIIETKNRAFEPSGPVFEQLHKFSSSRYNDWLFYAVRHRNKLIIIIQDSSRKAKTRLPPKQETNYLSKMADSVYDAANLGFLESLGGDVRLWLGGIERHSELSSN